MIRSSTRSSAETYIEAVDVLTASRRTGRLAGSAVREASLWSLGDPETLDLDRVRHLNDVVLEAVVDARPQVRLFDLFEILCPDGAPLTTVDDVAVLRPDGVHLGSDGSLWLAETYGAEIWRSASRSRDPAQRRRRSLAMWVIWISSVPA